MIIGIGTDVIRISRVRRLVERFAERIGNRVFTPAELAYCSGKADPAVSLAGRFAAKEAVMKALGTGWRGGVRFVDIEVVREPDGRPTVLLRGVIAEIAQARGISRWHLSIAHDGDVATAVAVAERDAATAPPKSS